MMVGYGGYPGYPGYPAVGVPQISPFISTVAQPIAAGLAPPAAPMAFAAQPSA